MQSVMETAERLQSTHDVLQDQVQRLERELAEANAQLHRSRELASLGEMAAGIAHEIRNPLASIQLYAEVLAEDLGIAAGAGRSVPEDRSLGSSHGCHRSRCTAVRTRIDGSFRGPMPASSLIERVVSSCGDSASSVQVSIGMDPAIRVDPSLMLQALGNIVRNGLESMETRGRWESTGDRNRTKATAVPGRAGPLRARSSGWRTGVVVSPSLDQERLFNPFFTTRASGTGLGLAIAHRVVDAHGGHIHVSNRSGGGTRFDVCVPASGWSREHRLERWRNTRT